VAGNPGLPSPSPPHPKGRRDFFACPSHFSLGRDLGHTRHAPHITHTGPTTHTHTPAFPHTSTRTTHRTHRTTCLCPTYPYHTHTHTGPHLYTHMHTASHSHHYTCTHCLQFTTPLPATAPHTHFHTTHSDTPTTLCILPTHAAPREVAVASPAHTPTHCLPHADTHGTTHTHPTTLTHFTTPLSLWDTATAPAARTWRLHRAHARHCRAPLHHLPHTPRRRTRCMLPRCLDRWTRAHLFSLPRPLPPYAHASRSYLRNGFCGVPFCRAFSRLAILRLRCRRDGLRRLPPARCAPRRCPPATRLTAYLRSTFFSRLCTCMPPIAPAFLCSTTACMLIQFPARIPPRPLVQRRHPAHYLSLTPRAPYGPHCLRISRTNALVCCKTVTRYACRHLPLSLRAHLAPRTTCYLTPPFCLCGLAHHWHYLSLVPGRWLPDTIPYFIWDKQYTRLTAGTGRNSRRDATLPRLHYARRRRTLSLAAAHSLRYVRVYRAGTPLHTHFGSVLPRFTYLPHCARVLPNRAYARAPATHCAAPHTPRTACHLAPPCHCTHAALRTQRTRTCLPLRVHTRYRHHLPYLPPLPATPPPLLHAHTVAHHTHMYHHHSRRGMRVATLHTRCTLV